MLLRATDQVTVRRSSRAGTCWMNCFTRSSYVCRAVWSAAALLPRQPYSRSGADCSGLPCRYATLMMAMAERRPAACPTAYWCRWCIGAGSVGAGSQPAPTDGTCAIHLTIHGMRWMGMSCIACREWLFRCDRSRYAPRSRAALCPTYTQVVTFFAHEQHLSHCARSCALSRCIAVARVSRHEWAADGRSGRR